MTNPSRRVTRAEYTDPAGVTLVLECGHKLWVAGFPRDPIPSCFRIQCQEAPCYKITRTFGH